MTPTRVKMRLAALAAAGFALITTATCDPYTGVLDFYRDDDRDHFFGGYYYDEVVYYEDDCFWFFCF